MSDGWPWPDALDAMAAAPASHRLLLDNAEVRVVEVVIAPGAREPMHTHRWSSVMIVDQPTGLLYHGPDGTVEIAPPERSATAGGPRVEWMEPEGPHAVENVDTVTYHAIRVELKGD